MKPQYKFGYSQIVKTQGTAMALQNSGLKATKQREAVLRVLVENRHPMTIDTILKKVNDSKTNITTIYRVLETFEKYSIAKRVNLKSGSAFYEISDAHHHHIVCSDCGDIEELEDCTVLQIKPTSQKFDLIFDHSLEFFGRCKKCIKG